MSERAPSSISTRSEGLVEDLREPAFAYLAGTLGAEGWKVWRTRKGLKAQRGWLTVGLKPKTARRSGTTQWRARLRDGFPRELVEQRWDEDPVQALRPVVAQARAVHGLCSGEAFLPGCGQTWLGHRLWQAVRPLPESGAED